MMRVYRGLASCRASTDAELRAWLRQILRREIAGIARREAWKARVTVALDLAFGFEGPDPDAESSPPALDRLQELLDDLKPDDHTLLWMKFSTDAKWREIAAALEIPATAARRRYQRLIERLRRQMDEGVGS